MPLIAMQRRPPLDDQLRAGTSLRGLGASAIELAAQAGAAAGVQTGGATGAAAGVQKPSGGGSVAENIKAAGEITKQGLITYGAVQQILKPQKPGETPQVQLQPPKQKWYEDWKMLILVGVGVATLGTAGYFALSTPKRTAANPRRRRGR